MSEQEETVFIPGAGKIHPASLTEAGVAEARELRARHDAERRKASKPFSEAKVPLDTSEVVEDAEDANGGVSQGVTSEDEAGAVVPVEGEAAPAADTPADEARAEQVRVNLARMSKPQLKVMLDQMNVRFKSKDSKDDLLRLAIKAVTPEEAAGE